MSKMAEHYLGDGYPTTPGYKAEGTSRDAALVIKREASNLRALVLAAISAAGPEGLTADEVAGRLNKSVLAIRPRLTELGPKHFNKIERIGRRRTNASGLNAAVWKERL